MSYQILFEKASIKSLRKLPADAQVKIIEAIEKLSEEPRPHSCKKLEGREGYRIRIGDYRVIYLINDNTVTVLILDIGKRKEIYKKK
jgi:mRNA interferase RelE/StbE